MQNKIDREGKTIVLYSYKGGVGRTMALANIACLMAKQGKKILLIDWDLEAPGLDSYFTSIRDEDLGLVDMITDAKVFLQNNDEKHQNNKDEYECFLEENLTKYISESIKINESAFEVDVIKAGKFDKEYVNKLEAIDWMKFYKEEPAFFRTFAHFLEKRYDYILIDSRTGLADTSGICTMLMPQVLVLVFSLNRQNLNGVIDVARQSVEYRHGSFDYRNLTVLPLPSRIDFQNDTDLKIWEGKYKEKFETLFKELYSLDDCDLKNYFNVANIPYKSSQAYGENITTLKEDANNKKLISFHYKNFLELIELEEQIWEILNEEQEHDKNVATELFKLGVKKYQSKNYSDSCNNFQEAYQLYPSNDKGYYQWKIDILYQWGNALFYLAELEDNLSLLEQVYIKYKDALSLDEYQSSLFCNTNIANLILNIPIEIEKQGTTTIAVYLSMLLKEDDTKIYEARIIILGDGGAGKTTLKRRLLDENVELPKIDERTRGIEIVDFEFEKGKIVHIWDFGGQMVYYPVHRFFITENTVFVLLASTRQKIHNFDYWLPTIFQFGGRSPVIIGQTCHDGITISWNDLGIYLSNPNFNIIKISDKPYCEIDLTNNRGLKEIKECIISQIENLPNFGKPVPKSWSKVRNALLSKSELDAYMSFQSFKTLCKGLLPDHFKKEEDIEDCCNFLHNIGTILWYSKTEELKNWVILKPEWAMNAVYQIIDDNDIQNNKGYIRPDDFTKLWNYKSNEEHIILKKMLETFKIAFPTKHSIGQYILPARLRSMPPEKKWKAKKNSLHLEYKFEFMPKGVVNQLSAELSRYIQDNEVWNDAVNLTVNDTKSQIIEDSYNRKLTITSKGNEARSMNVLVMNSLKNIIESYKGVKEEIYVKCTCRTCRQSEEPTTFSYGKLCEWSKNRDTVICNDSGESLKISNLLYNVGFEKKGTQQSIKKVSIFLASSEELRDDREQFEIFIYRETKELINKGVFIELVIWEDFIDCMSQTRLQDEYSKAVVSSDIFISLFWTKAGKYTKEEFRKVFGHFEEKGKPFIYTYFKNAPIDISGITKNDINSLLNFKKELKELGHYPTDYENIDDLKCQFKMQLHKLITL